MSMNKINTEDCNNYICWLDFVYHPLPEIMPKVSLNPSPMLAQTQAKTVAPGLVKGLAQG